MGTSTIFDGNVIRWNLPDGRDAALRFWMIDALLPPAAREIAWRHVRVPVRRK